jgi:hypothetical protein
VREQFARGRPTAPAHPPRPGQRLHPTGRPTSAGPSFLGTRLFAYDLADLARHIDWSPFFASWELIGRYPQILEDDVVGEAATSLFADAQAMLQKIIGEQWFEARGVVGFWPANSDGDDIVVYADETRTTELARLHTLRQQMAKDKSQAEGGRANVALGRLHRARRDQARLDRRLRGHRRPRRGGDRQGLQGQARRLFGDHGLGAGRPLARPSPRRCTGRSAPSSGAMRRTSRSTSTP